MRSGKRMGSKALNLKLGGAHQDKVFAVLQRAGVND